MELWTSLLIIALTTAWLLVRVKAFAKALFPETYP
jgi:hypothetical protein